MKLASHREINHSITGNPPYLGTYDVIVIGAGIVGAMIARELTRYEGRVALLEKESFSGCGVSKANLCMLHSPLMFQSGPLRIKLMHNAGIRYKKLANELDVVFREVDEIFVAFDASQLLRWENARNWAIENKVSAGHELISAEKLRELEPHVSRRIIGALYGKGVGAIHAPEWTFALTENAVANGLSLYLRTPVMDIWKQKDFAYMVKIPRGYFKTKYIINAGGLFADEIAGMVGDRDIHLTISKGTMAILDKSVSHLVRSMVYGTFSMDLSQMISPTAHGNILIGVGTFTKAEHKRDTKVDRERLKEIIDLAKELVPAVSEKDVITSFSGIRSMNNKAPQGDFYIDHSDHAAGVIHAVIGSPGLTAAPAIAELIIEKLADAGMVVKEKKDFEKRRNAWPRFATASFAEREHMISLNPEYGHIICRCEQVTKGEIIEAIRRGADTLDAVKHMTRAGMGRCQGGFCGISTLRLLADQLGILPSQVTMRGDGSAQIVGFTKEKARGVKAGQSESH